MSHSSSVRRTGCWNRALHQRRLLHFEALEARLALSATPLFDGASAVYPKQFSISTTTGEKPQSKVWEQDGAWFSVLPDSKGTWVRRLDGNNWTSILRLTPEKAIHADVKPDGDLVHVLLYDGTQSQVETLELVAGDRPMYQSWTLQPQLVDVVLTKGVETATIDLDGSGRMWLASDAVNTIEVRYSDFPYTTFSPPITLAAGISSDDICAITALPGGGVGIMWSDQNRQQFGFRMHAVGADPTEWTAPEVAAASVPKIAKGGIADDHIHLAVAADGTLYAAVKTSFDTANQPQIGLLVRRPMGQWDPLYTVDTKGTRPIVVLNEEAQRLVVIYTKVTGGGDIVYRESPLDAISFGPRLTLLKGMLNNVSSTKQTFGNELVAIATRSGKAVSVKLSLSPPDPLLLALTISPLETGGVAKRVN